MGSQVRFIRALKFSRSVSVLKPICAHKILYQASVHLRAFHATRSTYRLNSVNVLSRRVFTRYAHAEYNRLVSLLSHAHLGAQKRIQTNSFAHTASPPCECLWVFVPVRRSKCGHWTKLNSQIPMPVPVSWKLLLIGQSSLIRRAGMCVRE